MMVEKASCVVCGSREGGDAFEVKEMMHGMRESFGYRQCSECQSIQAAVFNPDLSNYYAGDYYAHGAGGAEENSSEIDGVPSWALSMIGGSFCSYFDLLKHGPNGGLKPFLSNRLYQFYFEDYLSNRAVDVLDVGCGDGSFLSALRHAGFSGNLCGVDPFGCNSELSDDVVLYRGGLDRFDEFEHWDLITFNHSLEHMMSPLGELEIAHRLLRVGGVCMIRTPVVPNASRERYGSDWVSHDAPRHYFIASKKGILRMAENAGFEVIGQTYDSTAFQFWASEQYAQDISLYDERSWFRGTKNSIFSYGDMMKFEQQAVEMNRAEFGDQMAVYLKKKNR